MKAEAKENFDKSVMDMKTYNRMLTEALGSAESSVLYLLDDLPPEGFLGFWQELGNAKKRKVNIKFLLRYPSEKTMNRLDAMDIYYEVGVPKAPTKSYILMDERYVLDLSKPQSEGRVSLRNYADDNPNEVHLIVNRWRLATEERRRYIDNFTKSCRPDNRWIDAKEIERIRRIARRSATGTEVLEDREITDKFVFLPDVPSDIVVEDIMSWARDRS